MADGVHIDMRDVERAAMGLQEFRRTYFRAVRGGIKDAAERYIVPRIKARAVPRQYRGFVNAKTRMSGGDFQVVFSTRTLKSSRILGLQNFGGYLVRPVFPKRKKALLTPWGPRAVVRGNAYVRPKRFFEKGIDAGLPNFNREVGDAIADRLEEAFD